MPSTDLDILAKVDTEFKFLMDDAAVPTDIQLLVYKRGYDSTRIFAGLDLVSTSAGGKHPIHPTAMPYCGDSQNLQCNPMAIHFSARSKSQKQSWA